MPTGRGSSRLDGGPGARDHTVTPPPNDPKWIAPDEDERGILGHHIAPARADLLFQRLLNTSILSIERLGDVHELHCGRNNPEPYDRHTRHREGLEPLTSQHDAPVHPEG
jgi:hypothetical protein